MKIVSLKLKNRSDYFDRYVSLVISPFYKLSNSEGLILARLYNEVDTELNNGVPIDVALRIVGMRETRTKVSKGIIVTPKKYKGAESVLTLKKFDEAISRLKKLKLLDNEFRPLKSQLPSPKDNGFGFKITIDE